MSFRRISLVSIIVLLTIVFSSCHEDRDYYSWREGALQRVEELVAERDGYINRFFIIDERDIKVDTYFTSIEDFRNVGGSEIALYIKNYEYLDGLTLHVDGTRMDVDFPPLAPGEHFFDNRRVYDFMSVVVDMLHQNGAVRINAEGRCSGRNNKIPLEIELFTELDVYVRR